MKKKNSYRHKPGASSKAASRKEAVNPFELKINRERHSVLGQKLRNDKGKPGVSRSKAMKRRAEIFAKSSLLIKKSNAFVDKRIGEYNSELSKEEMIIERMAQARKKRFKKNIFNLNDEEPLTHYGQPLEGMEKFEAPENDSEDDEEDAQLNADFVDKAHFGGFLTKKIEDSDTPKSHKDVLGDLILESKKRKEEMKIEREMTEDLTEKLDKEWKEIHNEMPVLRRKDTESTSQKDPYDITVNELKFEPRAAAIATLAKSEEELKKAEEIRLKQLEEERLNRMRADDGHQSKNNENLSADSIYDGLDIEDTIQPKSSSGMGMEESGSNNNRNDDQLTTSDEESDDDNDDDDDDDVHSEGYDSDITDFSSEEEDEETEDAGKQSDNKNVEPQIHVDVPQSVDQFAALVSGKSKEDMSSIIKSIIRSNHPSRTSEGKKKLNMFFCILLKFVTKIARKCQLEYLDVLTPHLFSITQINGLKTGLIFKKFLIKKVADYEKHKVNNRIYPSVDLLITLKLCGILFPTSDYYHAVVTPAFLLMSDVLSSSYKMTLKNILLRLFVSSLFCEYVAFSKRFAAEAIVFLESILRMSSQNPTSNSDQDKRLRKGKRLLRVDSAVTKEPTAISLRLLHEDSEMEAGSQELRVSVVFCTVSVLRKLAELYAELPSFQEIFFNVPNLCDALPVQVYPSKLSIAVKDLKDFVCSQKGPRTFLTFPKKKPKMLKMFEPKFEMNESSKNMTVGQKIKLEKRLSQKIKKEEKSVMREVRRDAQFIARKQIEERREADEERKRKVKQIYQDLSVQESECKKFAKKK